MLTSGPAAAVAGGWQINGLLTLYSGNPFHATADGALLNLPGSTQRADLLGEPKQLGGYGRGLAWYDWRQFSSVPTARFGTAGYNILRAPGIRTVDLGIFRSFRVTERVGLQFRGEALNVGNTPQLAAPSNNISSRRSSARSDRSPGSAACLPDRRSASGC